MAVKLTSRHHGYSLGQTAGRALADRIIELSRDGATIIDNCPFVVHDRRKSAALGPSAILPDRRRGHGTPVD